jgi:hypothetical protein
MNAFKLPEAQRIEAWGNFRDSLPAMPEHEQLVAVAEFWQQCPFDRWVLDPLFPKEWMTVWEMLYAGQYCINGVAMGIEATLRYSGWDPSRLELVMIKEDDALSSEFFVVKIDNKYVLNYSYGQCVPIEDLDTTINFLYAYRWNGKNYAKI